LPPCTLLHHPAKFIKIARTMTCLRLMTLTVGSLALAALGQLAGCATGGTSPAVPATGGSPPMLAASATICERLPPVDDVVPSPAPHAEIMPASFTEEAALELPQPPRSISLQPVSVQEGPAQFPAPDPLPPLLQPPQPPPDLPASDALPIPRPPEMAEEVDAGPPTSPVIGAQPALPLDFSTALGLTQAQNPRIAFTQAQIAQAYAVNQASRVMWLPSLRAGLNFNKHEGRIQDVIGGNLETSRHAMYGGLGANAVGAGSPAIPGIFMQFHTTDAIFQRRITGFALNARQFQGTAAINDQLLETALAYLALLEALQRRAIAAETLQHGQQLADLTASFAQTGAGNLADADRAAAALALLKNEAVRTEESVTVASARVAQQLSADPSILILPQEPTVVPIDLVPPELATADLVATGLSNRPELAASRSLVGEAVSRLQRERHAPWLPSVLLGVSYGEFAAARGTGDPRPGDRFDLDAVAWWEVRNLGFGEAAARSNAAAQIQQAKMREVETMDLVAREIVEASTQVTARRRQIEVAKEGITSAQQSYDRNLERIRNAQGLPIEVLQSIQALDASRREYLRAVTDFNQAQFRLQRALGWPVAVPGA
jgi:outer membrane protein TolC